MSTWTIPSFLFCNCAGNEPRVAMAMNLLSHALRNVIRTRQRTLVVVGAMAFACFIMIFYSSLMEGWLQTTEENVIGNELGEVQIHAYGYRADHDLYNYMAESAELVERLEQHGFYAAPRLFGFGLAAAGDNSAGVRLRGVDLDREPLVTRVDKHLLAGSWLDRDHPEGIVIGRKVAKILGVEVGNEIVFVGQAADGSLANDVYRIRGILKSISDSVDRAGFFMSASSFRELMLLPEGAHEIAVRGGKGKQKDLGVLTAETQALAPGREVLSWRQLQPVLARIVDLSRSSLIIMLLVTYSAVGILTLNSMLMSIFERIREFGVMKALGFSPLGVFTLIVIESFTQVAMAAFLALTTAVPLSLFCETHPIDLSALASTSSSIAGIAFDPIWYSRVTAETIVLPIIFLFVVAGGAIMYPAAKAALIRPLEAIYHR
jgi:ABC-type lipoprotein release transport system permease subunit